MIGDDRSPGYGNENLEEYSCERHQQNERDEFVGYVGQDESPPR